MDFPRPRLASITIIWEVVNHVAYSPFPAGPSARLRMTEAPSPKSKTDTSVASVRRTGLLIDPAPASGGPIASGGGRTTGGKPNGGRDSGSSELRSSGGDVE